MNLVERDEKREPDAKDDERNQEVAIGEGVFCFEGWHGNPGPARAHGLAQP
jgi:hypothetical protein